MNNLDGNVFVDRIYEIDPSRSNVNRIMNPPARNFAVSTKETKGHEMAGTSSNADTSRMSGSLGSARTAGSAKTIRTSDSTGSNKEMKESCKPDGENSRDAGFKLEFTNDNMVNGIILSELLGKPKILQKRRW